MARKSIEDVMNEIEDFLNSCSTKALSSNKVIVPRDEFDELFGGKTSNDNEGLSPLIISIIFIVSPKIYIPLLRKGML